MPSLLTSLCGYPSSVLNSASLRGLLPHQQPIPHTDFENGFIHVRMCPHPFWAHATHEAFRVEKPSASEPITVWLTLSHPEASWAFTYLDWHHLQAACFQLTTSAQTIPDPSCAGPLLHVTSSLGPLGSLGFRGQKTSEEMDVHLREGPTTCGRNESGKGGEPLGPPANYQVGHFAICLQVLHQWITAAGSSWDSLYRDLRVCGENLANSPFLCTLCSFLDWLQWDCVCPLECP